MAISFGCPGCATPFNVTEDMAGKRAKCPKCLMVFTLPASAVPTAPVRSEAPAQKAGAALDDAFQKADRYEPDAKRSRRAAVDDDDDRERDRDRDEPRPRRSRAGRSSKGSPLPWILGIGAVALVLVLLCGGSITALVVVGMSGGKKAPAPAPIVAVNNPPVANPPIGPIANPPIGNPPIGNPPIGNPPVMPPPPPINVGPGQVVQLKQGPGTRLKLLNGRRTISSNLSALDPFDPEDKKFRCKLYSIDFQQGRTYVIDMLSPNAQMLDPYLRVEDMNEQVLARDDDGGGFPNARIFFTAPYTGSFVIVATCFNANNFGPFTLTIRENGK